MAGCRQIDTFKALESSDPKAFETTCKNFRKDGVYNEFTRTPDAIEELKGKARGKAEERFCITVEQRLKWLKYITEAGLDTYIDQNQNKRRENLAAARAAIATMNDMLGVSDGEASNRKKFNITLRVEDASLPE